MSSNAIWRSWPNTCPTAVCAVGPCCTCSAISAPTPCPGHDWAQSIHDLLVPGGVFLIRDDHPLLAAMEFEPWQITDDYLAGGGARTYDDGGTYTENSSGQITHTTNHEWRHDLGEVVGALLGAGLHIEKFTELPYMDWPAFPSLVSGPQGWTLPPGTPRIPLNFAIVARRPAS